MARKDRRFTPNDVARLYCKNLSERQKGVAIAIMVNCEADMNDHEFAAMLIRYIADIVAGIPAPGMRLLSGALLVLAEAVEIERTQDEIEDYLDMSGLMQ